MKDGWGEKLEGWPRALFSMPHLPVAPALMVWWEWQGEVTHLSVSPVVRWIHPGDMQDTSWGAAWDETSPGALQDNPLTQSSQPQGTQKIQLGSHPTLPEGRARDVPASVPQRTRILYGELQLYKPWNTRFSIPSKIPVCFLVTCGYSCYPCK